MPKRKKRVVKPQKPGVPIVETPFPFKEGEVVCDLKIVSVDLKAGRGIGFKQAVRRDVVEVNEKGERRLIPHAILKEPRTGKVVWGDLVRQMSVEDFRAMVKLRKTTQPEVE